MNSRTEELQYMKGSTNEPIVTETPRLREEIKRARVTPIKTWNPEANDEFRERIRHVLKPGELLLEFQARTGLGPAQACTMTPDEITRFVDQAAINVLNDAAHPSRQWTPERAPQHFTLD